MKNAGLCANGAKVYSEQGLEKKKKNSMVYLPIQRDVHSVLSISLSVNSVEVLKLTELDFKVFLISANLRQVLDISFNVARSLLFPREFYHYPKTLPY